MPGMSIKEVEGTENKSEFHKEASVMQLNSIHIQEEQFSVDNKTGKMTAT